MRITAAARAENRRRVLEEALRLFASRPYGEVTTRELAAAAGMATGTLFNYFASKETLAAELLDGALEDALADRVPRARGDEALEEDLFALVLDAIHAFAALRGAVGPVLATSLGPYAAGGDDPASRLRNRTLEAVRATVAEHGVPYADDPITGHLFWTLFLGVLAFWAADDSPDQEDTLVLLDQSMRLFAASLPAAPGALEVSDAQ